MRKQKIPFAKLQERFAKLKDQTIARVWFGDHSALYLELGAEIGSYESSGRPFHQTSVFVGYAWSLTTVAGSAITSADASSRALVSDTLEGTALVGVTVAPPGTLEIALEGGVALVTTPDEDGDQDWCIHANEDGVAIFQEGDSAYIESS